MHHELLGTILCGLFVAWLVWRALRRRKIRTSEWMPHELRASRLAYAEQLFRSTGPVAMSAKVDRAYRDRSGVVTLVELKTRKADKVYLSDVIELSAQRHALNSQTSEDVCEHGYVLVHVIARRTRVAHRVNLLTDEQLASLLARRELILAGAVLPNPSCSTALCERCAYAAQCNPTPASRGPG